MRSSLRHRILPAFSCNLIASVLVTGCGIGTPAVNVPEPAAAITGTVYGGVAPIVGATISLMQAGITGYGSAPSPLSSTTTKSDGSFSLPTHGTCPTPDRIVYIQAVGGNAGSDTGTNSAINLVALLGNCTTVGDSTHVKINEATTISAAYALAQFASVTASATGIGTSSTNLTGLNNTVGPANILVNTATGTPNPTSTSAGVVLPTAVVDTLADILASCTNSSIGTSANCTTLFNATTVNSVKPIDTFQAALNIALHPGTNVPTLLTLVSATSPFQPTIPTTSTTNDLTLAIGFNGGGIAARGTNSVAIDATGNAWVTDYYTDAAGTVSGLIEITPTGSYPGGPTGFGNSTLGPMNQVAIDQSGYIWVAVNSGAPSLTALTPSGNVYTTITGVTSPNGLAIDSAGDVWYSQGGNSYNQFAEYKNAGNGSYPAGTVITAAYHFGVDVCITPQDVWGISLGATNEPSAFVQYNLTSGVSTNAYTDGGNDGLSGCAVDNAGNLYLADFGSFNGVETVPASLNGGTSYAITSSVYAQEVVLDGLNNIFVATYVPPSAYYFATQNPASVVEFSQSGATLSPAAGYFPNTGSTSGSGTTLVGLTSQTIAPGGMAIDGSGNLWLGGNDGQSIPSTGNVNTGNLPVYVTEIVGIAAPVVTPKSVALTNQQIATRP